VSFVLTDALQLKKLDFLDGVFEDMPEIDKRDKDAVFDSDMAITTGELLELLPDLIEALGGEQVLGAAAAAPVLPTAQETGGTALPQAASVAAAVSASETVSAAETEGALESTPPWAD
jgi:recombination associated protein RdgC